MRPSGIEGIGATVRGMLAFSTAYQATQPSPLFFLINPALVFRMSRLYD